MITRQTRYAVGTRSTKSNPGILKIRQENLVEMSGNFVFMNFRKPVSTSLNKIKGQFTLPNFQTL